MVAFQHVRDFQNRISLGSGRDLGRFVDFFERSRIGNWSRKLWLGSQGRRNLGDTLGGALGACWPSRRRPFALSSIFRFVHRNEIVIPLLSHLASSATTVNRGFFGENAV